MRCLPFGFYVGQAERSTVSEQVRSTPDVAVAVNPRRSRGLCSVLVRKRYGSAEGAVSAENGEHSIGSPPSELFWGKKHDKRRT